MANDKSSAVLIPQPLGMADAVEGGVLGGVFEGGWVGDSKGFQLCFALVGEGVAHFGGLIVGTDELADVAAEGIAGEFYVVGEVVSSILNGMVRGAAVGVEQWDMGLGGLGQGLVGTCFDTCMAVAATVLYRGVVLVGRVGGNEFADVTVRT